MTSTPTPTSELLAAFASAFGWDESLHERDERGRFGPGGGYDKDSERGSKTQIARGDRVSAPTRTLVERGFIGPGDEVLHHGVGKAHADTAMMEEAGATVTEYDPGTPGADDRSALDRTYDAVVSNYVLNVLPPDTRDAVLDEIAGATSDDGQALITVRSADAVEAIRSGTPSEDGVVTSKGTFQKGFTPDELAAYVGTRFESTEPVPMKGSDVVTVKATSPIR